MKRIANISDDLAKFYLYDLSFAKHSVLSNLKGLGENVDHYYSLFGSLIEFTVEQIASVANQMIQSSNTSPSQLNSLLDLLTKYVGFYLDLLKTDSSSPLKDSIYQTFNCSYKTLEFLETRLSKSLRRVIELMIELKESTKKTWKERMFFLDPNSVEWSDLDMLDKLNSFLTIFFIDFRLGVPNADFPQQLSGFLSEKHWDFILCYVAEVVQRLDPVKNTDFRLIYVRFSNLVDSLVRCIEYRVRDNRTSTYPKSVFSDWNGFFAKETYDQLLVYFVALAESAENSTGDQNEEILNVLLEKLGNAVASIPFERLQLNALETRLNVLDLNLDTKLPVIFLNDKLKTVINYLVPLLTSRLACVQWSSYRIMRTIMREINRFYELKPTDQASVINTL